MAGTLRYAPCSASCCPPEPRWIRRSPPARRARGRARFAHPGITAAPALADRKSTRLNSSHLGISYAVFCLKTQLPLIIGAIVDCLKGAVTPLAQLGRLP